jgi:hypothetical protein
MSQHQKTLYRIYEYMTKTTWLHAEDALHFKKDGDQTPIPKIKLFAGLYNRGEGANAQLVHWLDADDARVVFADLSWGKSLEFVDYKGSNGAEPESRVLRINVKDDKVYFQLTKGPGKATATGAIMPNGQATDKINVGMTRNEARKMAYAILEHMQAYAAARIVATMAPSAAAPATTAKPKLTIEQTEDVLDDLFGYGDRRPNRARATGQTFRGRAVTTTAAPPIEAPVKVDGQLCYQNGAAVQAADLSMFQEYQAAHRGEAPHCRDVMIGWFYM